FDFYPRHVDAGRAFAAARFAGDAKFQRLRHLIGCQRIRPELAGDGEAERVGAPTRHITLVTGDAVTRTHDAAGKRAAGAVVVTHFDGALKATAGAGISRPVERGFERTSAIAGRVAKIFAIVESRRPHDFAGIE